MEANSIVTRSIPAAPLVAGIFFTVAGVMLTLDNFDVADAGAFLQYWPVALILTGLAKLFEERSSRVAAGALVVVGGVLLADNLDLIRVRLFDLWPLILIGLGAVFVARSMGVERPQAIGGGEGASEVAFLAERRVQVRQRDYRGGSASAFMGSLIVDLSEADIIQSPAVLDTRAMWGSVQVIVPERWDVVGDVTPFMAAFEMKTTGESDPSRRLIVRGGTVWGGIEVKTAVAGSQS